MENDTTGGTSSYTITVTYDCPYRDKCTDNGIKCDSCRHSPKRSYYEPIPEPYYPWYPYPYYPTYPYWITYTMGGDTGNSTFYEESK